MAARDEPAAASASAVRAAAQGRAWRRHQLVWLWPEAWAGLAAAPSGSAQAEAEADACIGHWRQHGLPLVVTRQPAAPAAPTPALTLGLAAPLRWSGRRVVLQVAQGGIARVGAFPEARTLLPQLGDAERSAWSALCARLEGAGLKARIYGSRGWQLLTGLPHVRPGSDIDLLLGVDDAAQADAAVEGLEAAAPGLPLLDGELEFGDGSAVAWREWREWRRGSVRQLLVKRLDGAALVSAASWAVGG
jgi:phosphoribosyl-dephospho-CoA transferase